MRVSFFFPVVLLAGCLFDGAAQYGGTETTWRLVELDGAPFTARATLAFPKRGRIGGAAPCNGYGADMVASYPLFRAERLVTTRADCPALDEERAFLHALEAVSRATRDGDTLLLTDGDGREMLFKADG